MELCSVESSSPGLVQQQRCCQDHGHTACALSALNPPFCQAGYWRASQPMRHHRRSSAQSAVSRRINTTNKSKYHSIVTALRLASTPIYKHVHINNHFTAALILFSWWLPGLSGKSLDRDTAVLPQATHALICPINGGEAREEIQPIKHILSSSWYNVQYILIDSVRSKWASCDIWKQIHFALSYIKVHGYITSSVTYWHSHKLFDCPHMALLGVKLSSIQAMNFAICIQSKRQNVNKVIHVRHTTYATLV